MQISRLDEMIRAERAVAPEAAADARIWAAIEHRLTHGPPPPDGVEAVGAAGGAAGKATLIIKVAAGVALIAAGAAGIASRGGSERPVREDMPVIAAVEPEVAPEVAAPEVEAPEVIPEVVPAAPLVAASLVAGPDVAPELAPAPKKSATKRKATKASEPEEPQQIVPTEPIDFTAELALIEKIRRELKLGAWTGALALVDEHARRFGARGQLVQERMAYHVLALCGLERVADARRIGGELVKKWPDSTHLPRLRGSCAFE